MPSFESALVALSPSSQIGIFITIFLCILTSSFACSTMPSASSAVTSALIGPSTRAVISSITFFRSLPSFAIRDGFVVTPLRTPSFDAAFISSTFAGSIKRFTIYSSFPDIKFYACLTTEFSSIYLSSSAAQSMHILAHGLAL